ncbi:MAG: hypothetical protein IJN50_02895 [Clostridia bacterium]|nr:hypothetical protein [Clostridia bacterium]
MSKFERIFKVEYYDIGEDRKATDKSILKYLQKIAGMHSDEMGCGLEELAKENLGWIITNWKLNVINKPKYNEDIIVKTWVRKIDKLYYYRDFEILNEQGEKIAIATSRWILMDVKNKTAKKVEDRFVRLHTIHEEEVFSNYKFTKIKEAESYENEFNYKVQRRDIDTNHHVNNLNYLDFAYETLPEEVYNNKKFNNIEISYKNEIKPNEEIVCKYSEINDNEDIIVIKNKETEIENAIIKLYV